jgi:hypothetical protein
VVQIFSNPKLKSKYSNTIWACCLSVGSRNIIGSHCTKPQVSREDFDVKCKHYHQTAGARNTGSHSFWNHQQDTIVKYGVLSRIKKSSWRSACKHECQGT